VAITIFAKLGAFLLSSKSYRALVPSYSGEKCASSALVLVGDHLVPDVKPTKRIPESLLPAKLQGVERIVESQQPWGGGERGLVAQLG
jgi:hypothetical protein